MIAVDTNIIVRLLTRDDDKQYRQSYQLFREQDILIVDTVILETECVLRFAYECSTAEISQGFRHLFGLKNVFLTNAQLIAKVIDWYEKGLDFADAFHLANAEQHDKLKTFDQKFVKRAEELSACVVEQP